MSREFTLTEVQSHNTKSDLYFIIRGKVYNSTSFVDEHPGGHEVLLDVAGTDATEAYVDAFHSDEADEILRDLEVGVLKLEAASSADVPPPVQEEQPSQVTNGVVEDVLKPDVFQEFPLQEKTVISHNVAIYRFKLPTPESVFGLPIGQHISIGAHLPKPSGELKEIIRSYTPISSDHQRGYFDLLIKSYPLGNISRHLDTLSIGDTIRVRGPKGAFTYTPNMVRRFGMIAGGTGITPMLQIIRAIQRGRATGDRTEVDLIFANVNEEDILLKDDLDTLTKEDAGIRVHYVLNNPPEGWTGGIGFVSADMITKWLPQPARDVKILLCGPPPMISAMKKITADLGFGTARPVSKLTDQVFAF